MQALIENKRRSISKIAGHLRGYFFRTKFNNYIRGIIGIQQYFWKYKEKLRKQMYLKKVVLIQSIFRGFKEKNIIKHLRNSQLLISKNFRRYVKYNYFKQVKKSVNILVPCVKKHLSFLIIKEHKDLKDFVYKIVRNAFDRIILREKVEKSIIINAFFRRILFQINHPKLMAQIKKSNDMRKMIKSALIIQRYYRTYKAFKEFNYKKFAADLIRGYWKMKKSVHYIDELYNSIIPIQRGVRKYLNVKRSYTIAMKSYMEQKYNNYSASEIKKTLHYFRIVQREYLQKEGYIKKNKNGIPKIVNINNDKGNKYIPKSYIQKIVFFTEVNDIDVYNSSILVYNNEFWCDKFYKLLKVDKKIFGNNSSFLNIKTGETFTCLLNSKGKIYTFGWNDFGQCNIDTITSEQKHITSLVFSQIECCNKYSFLMNNRGELSQNFEKYNDYSFDGFTSDHSDSVYAWKDNYYYKFKEKKINKYKININIKKNSIIKKIACGKNFVIFLSDSGLVYSYGKNTKGQLGLEDYKERNTPTLNELLVKNGERIIDVSCGFKHTIALGINGKAYSWGSNSNGQCGIDIGGNFNTPMYIDVKNKIKFIGICCGFRASFFMDDQRLLYFCGKSGINNGENYFLYPFKNIIGEEETMKLANDLNQLNDHKNIENINHSINNTNKKKNKRSSSTLNINRNNSVRMVSCLNKNTYPVKLNCSWNESFSVMYVTYADTTNLVNNVYKKELNKSKVKYILDKITLNWITDNSNVRNVMKNCKDIIEYL
jgi:alpha-tubulin suppressor-like RCC1 family protein